MTPLEYILLGIILLMVSVKYSAGLVESVGKAIKVVRELSERKKEPPAEKELADSIADRDLIVILLREFFSDKYHLGPICQTNIAEQLVRLKVLEEPQAEDTRAVLNSDAILYGEREVEELVGASEILQAFISDVDKANAKEAKKIAIQNGYFYENRGFVYWTSTLVKLFPTLVVWTSTLIKLFPILLILAGIVLSTIVPSVVGILLLLLVISIGLLITYSLFLQKEGQGTTVMRRLIPAIA